MTSWLPVCETLLCTQQRVCQRTSIVAMYLFGTVWHFFAILTSFASILAYLLSSMFDKVKKRTWHHKLWKMHSSVGWSHFLLLLTLKHTGNRNPWHYRNQSVLLISIRVRIRVMPRYYFVWFIRQGHWSTWGFSGVSCKNCSYKSAYDCTAVVHIAAQNSSDHPSCYPPVNHRCPDDETPVQRCASCCRCSPVTPIAISDWNLVLVTNKKTESPHFFAPHRINTITNLNAKPNPIPNPNTNRRILIQPKP